MKTIAKILIVISIFMLSSQVNAKSGQGLTSSSSNTITYKVMVHLDKHNLSFVCGVFVVITDENGRMIAPPQQLKPRDSEYDFKEAGPVKGTRIAQLSNGLRPHTDLYMFNPDVHTGLFLGGESYLFNLYVSTPAVREMKAEIE
jgi:hypothetical protein